LKDIRSQSVKWHKAGASVAEAARQIDLRSHAADYPNIKGVGADPLQVTRIYQLLDGK
jgi:hypothetical protein